MTDLPEKKWMLYTKRADFSGLAAKFGIDPVIVRILRNRDITDEREIQLYLRGGLRDLYDSRLLPHAEEAAGLIREKLLAGAHIRIVGDYDIDGVCSTYILYEGLRRAADALQKDASGVDSANAADRACPCIDYVIPDRVRDGYGINEQIIEQAVADGVDTIVTCDNGIAAIEELRFAKEHGLTVIVTDHHDVRTEKDAAGETAETAAGGVAGETAGKPAGGAAGETAGKPAEDLVRELLPPADLIVNPKLAESRYPVRGICGAVVAWKLIGILYEICGIPEKEWLAFLEFAAIATVGDVMELRGENRMIVKAGLSAINSGSGNLGLRKLILACGMEGKKLTAYHIGFVIGPCINAGGRLETAEAALRLFLSTNEKEAEHLAAHLCSLNDERKAMTEKGVEAAAAQAEQAYADDDVLVLYLPDLHESLAGIVAGRIRERFGKPCFVLTDSGEFVKGSGRSIEKYHMFEGLCGVSELLMKFGGHPMAAGLSLARENVGMFRKKLNEQAKKKLTPEDFIQTLWIDLAMPLSYISGRLVRELSMLEPFGNGNEKPVFAAKGVQLTNLRVLGKNRNVLKCRAVDPSGYALSAVMFGEAERFYEELSDKKRVNIIYYPEINEYNGSKTLQIVIGAYRSM